MHFQLHYIEFNDWDHASGVRNSELRLHLQASFAFYKRSTNRIKPAKVNFKTEDHNKRIYNVHKRYGKSESSLSMTLVPQLPFSTSRQHFLIQGRSVDCRALPMWPSSHISLLWSASHPSPECQNY